MEKVALHRQLAMFARARQAPALPVDNALDALDADHAMRSLELAMVEDERAAVADRAADVPHDSGSFVHWFEHLRDVAPVRRDPLYPWLATDATLEQMTWFLRQELAIEPGFDDLVAMVQVGFPERAKLELARNYWDEMGHGHARAMHGAMLARLARDLDIDLAMPVAWEALAVSNLMSALAANRRYAYHAIGALGVVELMSPIRAAMIDAGLTRLGVDPHARQYYALHATIDEEHAATWCSEIIAPLVDGRPEIAVAIAEGALMRLGAATRCLVRYRKALDVPTEPELVGAVVARHAA
nr:iron-containing redox enzyme family protein [Kofleriaceae bacterium]